MWEVLNELYCLDNSILGIRGLGRYQELAIIEEELLRRYVPEWEGFARVVTGQENMPGMEVSKSWSSGLVGLWIGRSERWSWEKQSNQLVWFLTSVPLMIWVIQGTTGRPACAQRLPLSHKCWKEHWTRSQKAWLGPSPGSATENTYKYKQGNHFFLRSSFLPLGKKGVGGRTTAPPTSYSYHEAHMQ